MVSSCVILFLIAFWPANALAQTGTDSTLSDRIAQTGNNVTITLSLDRSPSTRFDSTVKRADLLVRGVIDEAHSRLTPDGRSIATDYLIGSPQIFFSRLPPIGPSPAMPSVIVFTMHGGSVSMRGHKATVLIDGVLPPMPGMDVVLLLELAEGGGFVPMDVGLFEVRASQIVPLVLWPGDHLNFQGSDVDSFINEIVNPSIKH